MVPRLERGETGPKVTIPIGFVDQGFGHVGTVQMPAAAGVVERSAPVGDTPIVEHHHVTGFEVPRDARLWTAAHWSNLHMAR